MTQNFRNKTKRLMARHSFHHSVYFLLLVFMSFTSCTGQIKTQPQEIVNEPKSLTNGQLKIIKHKDTNQYNGVNCGLQDKEGNLWFSATGQGVYRYDGKTFTNFTEKDGLCNNNVYSILEDKTGNIWFGTNAGLCRYDGKTFTGIRIPVSNTSNAYPINNPATKNAVWSMLQDKSGKFWFGTSEGVYCYDGKFFTHLLDNDGVVNSNSLQLKMIQCIIEDKKGNIWFASGLGGCEGVCLYDGKTITNFKPGGESNVRKVLEDKNGTIWIAYQNCNIFYYDGKTFTSFKAPPRLKEHTCNTIAEDKAGNIWFGLDYRGYDIDDTSGGVWRYNPALNATDSKAFTNFTTKDGLSNNSVYCILQDKEGNMWFGTRNLGLCRYDGKTFTNFSEESSGK